jgi:hypothetical protein
MKENDGRVLANTLLALAKMVDADNSIVKSSIMELCTESWLKEVSKECAKPTT